MKMILSLLSKIAANISPYNHNIFQGNRDDVKLNTMHTFIAIHELTIL